MVLFSALGMGAIGVRRPLLTAGNSTNKPKHASAGCIVVDARHLSVMFTDIKGFTVRTSKSTREDLVQLLKAHEDIVLPVASTRGGNRIKSIGDAFLLTFESPTNAVLAGIEVQRALRAYNTMVSEEEAIEIRVAINAGEVTVIENDIYGDAVNIAARIEGLAEANEIYLSEAVYLALNKREVARSMQNNGLELFEVGYRKLKGVEDEVKIFKIVRTATGENLSLESDDPCKKDGAASVLGANVDNMELDDDPTSEASPPDLPAPPPAQQPAPPPTQQPADNALVASTVNSLNTKGAATADIVNDVASEDDRENIAAKSKTDELVALAQTQATSAPAAAGGPQAGSVGAERGDERSFALAPSLLELDQPEHDAREARPSWRERWAVQALLGLLYRLGFPALVAPAALLLTGVLVRSVWALGLAVLAFVLVRPWRLRLSWRLAAASRLLAIVLILPLAAMCPEVPMREVQTRADALAADLEDADIAPILSFGDTLTMYTLNLMRIVNLAANGMDEAAKRGLYLLFPGPLERRLNDDLPMRAKRVVSMLKIFNMTLQQNHNKSAAMPATVLDLDEEAEPISEALAPLTLSADAEKSDGFWTINVVAATSAGYSSGRGRISLWQDEEGIVTVDARLMRALQNAGWLFPYTAVRLWTARGDHPDLRVPAAPADPSAAAARSTGKTQKSRRQRRSGRRKRRR